MARVKKKIYVRSLKIRLPENRQERIKVLGDIFQTLGHIPLYANRIAHLSKITGLGKVSMYVMGKEGKWKSFMPESIAAPETEQVNGVAKNTQVDRFSFVDLSKNVKDYVGLGLKASHSVVEHGSRMIQYYAEQITKLLNERGSYDALTKADRIQFDYFELKLKKYTEFLTPFIAPDKLARYATVIGLDQLDDQMRDIEFGAFTPKSLIETLIKLGMKTPFDDKNIVDVGYEEIKMLTTGPVPEIDGRKLGHEDDGLKKHEKKKTKS